MREFLLAPDLQVLVVGVVEVHVLHDVLAVLPLLAHCLHVFEQCVALLLVFAKDDVGLDLVLLLAGVDQSQDLWLAVTVVHAHRDDGHQCRVSPTFFDQVIHHLYKLEFE